MNIINIIKTATNQTNLGNVHVVLTLLHRTRTHIYFPKRCTQLHRNDDSAVNATATERRKHYKHRRIYGGGNGGGSNSSVACTNSLAHTEIESDFCYYFFVRIHSHFAASFSASSLTLSNVQQWYMFT